MMQRDLTPTRIHLRSQRFSWLFTCLMLLMASSLLLTPAYANDLAELFGGSSSEQTEFLPVDEAFTLAVSQNNNKLIATFDITPEHYIYKDKLSLQLPKGVVATPFTFNQTAKTIDDPNFGKVPIFDQAQVTATATLTNQSNRRINESAVVNWQGCAKAGLCYPPERQSITLSLPAAKAATPKPVQPAEADKPNPAADNVKSAKTQPVADTTTRSEANNPSSAQSASNDSSLQQSDNRAATNTPAASDTTEGDNKTTSALVSPPDGEVDPLQTSLDIADLQETTDANTTPSTSVLPVGSADPDSQSAAGLGERADDAAQDPFGLMTHPWLALGLIFLAGLGLAFTPCILPMLPIVSNIVARQHRPTWIGGVLLSGAYALGVATAYGILGALIAVFGQSLGIIGWLQNPVILLVFALVFALLALYMLGVINVRLPASLRNKLQSTSQKGDKYLGSVGGSAVAGFLSALVVSPCVSAPLFGALIAVSTIGNPWLGFAALFLLGFGLSVPLIILGATQGSIMPKAGAWMDWVKQGFALLLFAVSLLLIERVLISPWMLLLWAFWFMVVATWAWSWQGKGQLLSRAAAGVMSVWAVCLLLGVALGSTDNWQPLRQLLPQAQISSRATDRPVAANPVATPQTVTLTSLAQLKPVIANSPKVLVDVTAEWCIECRIMEKTLFTNPPVQLNDWQVVKLDITDTTDDSKAILQTFKLFGPPALLYFVDGQLVTQQVGEVSRAEFEQTLGQL